MARFTILLLLASSAHGLSALSAMRPAVGALHAKSPALRSVVRTGASYRRAAGPRLELGLQVDPAASAGSIFVLGGFVALQLKIRSAIAAREARDAAIETLRKAEVLQLAGKLTAEEVESARRVAQQAADDYETTREIVALGGALLRVPDPSAAEATRRLEPPGTSQPPVAAPPPPSPQTDGSMPTAAADKLDGVREALGLENRAPASSQTNGSLLPTGSASVTPKDVAISLVLLLQIGWFLLSLTDPIGAPNALLESALTSGGEAVDRMEARKAAESAEYRAMLQQAVDAGEAPPTCATRKLDDPLGGCGGAVVPLPETLQGDAVRPVVSPAPVSAADPEFRRTRGLDANRDWISGRPARGGSDVRMMAGDDREEGGFGAGYYLSSSLEAWAQLASRQPASFALRLAILCAGLYFFGVVVLAVLQRAV